MKNKKRKNKTKKQIEYEKFKKFIDNNTLSSSLKDYERIEKLYDK